MTKKRKDRIVGLFNINRYHRHEQQAWEMHVVRGNGGIYKDELGNVTLYTDEDRSEWSTTLFLSKELISAIIKTARDK